MDQLTRIWNSLTVAQRISLAVVPVLICAMAFGVIRWRHESDFRSLYTSLTPEDASAVVQKVHEAGIEYRLNETGSTVLVPSAQLAEARLAIAGAGLPHSGRIGFELFDKANLGASDFAEQVNYRRALEGELERTVATLSEIDQARIHVTFAKESVFLDARQPAKATVVLRLKREARLQQSNVTAIANLIASAVDGLAPESVAIIDSAGRLLNRPRSTEDGEAKLAEANLDYRHQVEAELLAKINSSLEPLLGAGRFRAGVNAECDFNTVEENDETFAAAKSTILQSQTTEESTSGGLSGGLPGTATNLPQPAAKAPSSATGVIRRTENVSYQPGRTVRHTLSPKGTVRRISTAILVDQALRWEGVGLKARKTLVPPTPEVIKGVRDIIAGITGYNEQRGDQITVESLPFESTLSAEPPPPSTPAPKAPRAMDLTAPWALGGIAVILLLILAVLFLAMRKPAPTSRKRAEDTAPEAVEAPLRNAPAAVPGAADHNLEQQIADNEVEHAQIEAEALSRIKLPANTRKTEVLVKHIRDAVQKDPISAANVLRTWVTDVDTRRTS